MNFDMPKAVFCGLALIAAAIFVGPGSGPATAQGGIQKIAICEMFSNSTAPRCAKINSDGRILVTNRRAYPPSYQ